MELVVWLAAQIKDYCDLDETINGKRWNYLLKIYMFYNNIISTLTLHKALSKWRVPSVGNGIYSFLICVRQVKV